MPDTQFVALIGRTTQETTRNSANYSFLLHGSFILFVFTSNRPTSKTSPHSVFRFSSQSIKMNPNPNTTQTPSDHPQTQTQSNPQSHSVDYAPYPKIDLDDVVLPPPTSTDTWTSVPVGPDHPPPPEHIPRDPSPPQGPAPATTMPADSNPYVSPAPAAPPASSMKNKMESVKDVLGKWGKKAAETTKKAEDLAGNMWQHLKTSPSLADAAVSRIAQGTKVLIEGGYEKIFRQSFETVPEENLLNSFPCYLSTSAGPVMGTLYLSTAKLAFCSDDPLSYKVGEETQWSYYKVVLPLHQLRAVNTSTSKVNSAEKYIQIISVDNHEFWFLGFVTYDSAVKSLQGALQPPHP